MNRQVAPIEKNTQEYAKHLSEIQKMDILAILIELTENDSNVQHGRRWTAVTTGYHFIDAQQVANEKAVDAKRQCSPWLDGATVVFMAVCGFAGGQTTAAGMTFYAFSQGSSKVSEFKEKSNQANSSDTENKARRYDNLIGDQSQTKQGSDKGFGDALETWKRVAESYQRSCEAAAAA